MSFLFHINKVLIDIYVYYIKIMVSLYITCTQYRVYSTKFSIHDYDIRMLNSVAIMYTRYINAAGFLQNCLGCPTSLQIITVDYRFFTHVPISQFRYSECCFLKSILYITELSSTYKVTFAKFFT